MNGNVHNYYEARVFHEMERRIESENLKVGCDEIDDIACIALNRLPPRYVRFDIDTTFYASPEEIQMMSLAVESAVKYAFEKVLSGESR